MAAQIEIGPGKEMLFRVDDGTRLRNLTAKEQEEWKGVSVRRFGPNHLWLKNTDTDKRFTKRNLKSELEKMFGVKILETLRGKQARDSIVNGHVRKEVIRKRVYNKETDECETVFVEEEVKIPIQEQVAWDQKCHWVIKNDRGIPFSTEKECDEAMERDTDKLYRIAAKAAGVSHVQPKRDRGAVRIAQDVPDKGACKRYFYLICTTYHKKGVRCSCPLDILDISENKNLYEVVKAENPRRHYFDVEWLADTDKEGTDILKKILTCFIEFAGLEGDTPLYVSQGSRWKGENKYKHSYHVVFRDVLFKNLSDHSRYMKAFRQHVAQSPYANDLAQISEYKSMTRRCFNYYYDIAVYTKNRLMRLPGQCKPEMDVPLTTLTSLEGFNLIQKSITIAPFGDCNPKFIKVTDDMVPEDPFQYLAPIHLNQYEEVLFPSKLERSYVLCEDKRANLSNMDIDNQVIRPWKDISAKFLRKEDFNTYLGYVGAVVDLLDPPEDEVKEWMNHSQPCKAEGVYNYVKTRQLTDDWSRVHWTILARYGVIDAKSTRVEEAFDLFFKKGPALPLDYIENTVPEFEKRRFLDLNTKVNVVSGSVGVGKTVQTVKYIAEDLPLGSSVLYVVGRKKLAREIVSKFMTCERVIASLFPKKPRDDYVIVEVAVINSLVKFGDRHRDLVVVDEMMTTLGNLEMEQVHVKPTCYVLYKLVLAENTRVRFIDAMFTIPGILFIKALFSSWGVCLPIGDGKDPKELKYTEMVPDSDSDVKTRRVIVPLKNDITTIRLYNETLMNDTSPEKPRNKGFLMRLFWEVLQKGANVAVAVPTLQWANILTNLLEKTGVKVQVVNSETKEDVDIEMVMHNKDNRVLIYTSAISAGHSITLTDHYDSIFVIVPQVTSNGRWKTPTVDEMIQMTARVRFPVSDKIFVTVDSGNYRQKKSQTLPKMSDNTVKALDGVKIGGNVPLDLFDSCRTMCGEALAKLSKEEYMEFVLRWMVQKAFPGSVIKEESLPPEYCHMIVLEHMGIFAEAESAAKTVMVFNSLKNPDVFFKPEVSKDGRQIKYKRKAVKIEAFEELPSDKYTKYEVEGNKFVIGYLR